MSKKSLTIYSQFLFALFAIEEETKINLHSNLPLLGALFQGESLTPQAESVFTDNVVVEKLITPLLKQLENMTLPDEIKKTILSHLSDMSYTIERLRS